MSDWKITDYAMNHIRLNGGKRIRGFAERRISPALAPDYNTDTLAQLGAKVGLSHKEVSTATQHIAGAVGRFVIRLILVIVLMLVIFVGFGGVSTLPIDPAITTTPTYTPGFLYASISPKEFT